ITREASFSARDAFISPSAAITLRGETGQILTSLISTRSTLIPQSSVQSGEGFSVTPQCVDGSDAQQCCFTSIFMYIKR
uniref:Uncharacterized protein n=1 Tax=Echeneis naucrates TaxID=173247 RepID=A0A665VRE6_ECHNA